MASAIACVAGSTAQDTQISNLARNMGCSKPVILRILFFRFSRRVFDKGIGRDMVSLPAWLSKGMDIFIELLSRLPYC